MITRTVAGPKHNTRLFIVCSFCICQAHAYYCTDQCFCIASCTIFLCFSVFHCKLHDFLNKIFTFYHKTVQHVFTFFHNCQMTKHSLRSNWQTESSLSCQIVNSIYTVNLFYSFWGCYLNSTFSQFGNFPKFLRSKPDRCKAVTIEHIALKYH